MDNVSEHFKWRSVLLLKQRLRKYQKNIGVGLQW